MHKLCRVAIPRRDTPPCTAALLHMPWWFGGACVCVDVCVRASVCLYDQVQVQFGGNRISCSGSTMGSWVYMLQVGLHGGTRSSWAASWFATTTHLCGRGGDRKRMWRCLCVLVSAVRATHRFRGHPQPQSVPARAPVGRSGPAQLPAVLEHDQRLTHHLQRGGLDHDRATNEAFTAVG